MGAALWPHVSDPHPPVPFTLWPLCRCPVPHGPTYPGVGCALESFTTPLPSVPDILLPDEPTLPLPRSHACLCQLLILLRGAGHTRLPLPASPTPGSGAAPGQTDRTAGLVQLPPCSHTYTSPKEAAPSPLPPTPTSPRWLWNRSGNCSLSGNYLTNRKICDEVVITG